MADFALGPNLAAVPINDPLDSGEADAGTGKLSRGVESSEGTKKLVGVSHVKAYAVIAHEISGSAFACRPAKFDPCGAFLRQESARSASLQAR